MDLYMKPTTCHLPSLHVLSVVVSVISISPGRTVMMDSTELNAAVDELLDSALLDSGSSWATIFFRFRWQPVSRSLFCLAAPNRADNKNEKEQLQVSADFYAWILMNIPYNFVNLLVTGIPTQVQWMLLRFEIFWIYCWYKCCSIECLLTLKWSLQISNDLFEDRSSFFLLIAFNHNFRLLKSVGAVRKYFSGILLLVERQNGTAQYFHRFEDLSALLMIGQ